MIDTLAASEQLVDAGIPADHTRAIARLMSGAQVTAREDLATKSDVDGVRKEIAASADLLRQGIKAANAELKADMVRWLFASQLAIVVALAGLMAFFKHFG